MDRGSKQYTGGSDENNSHGGKKKHKNSKWLSEEALQIYPSEFRVPKNSKERKIVFLSDQCKDIEENSIMQKTRDLFKKIREMKGISHAKMGTTKDINSMDLTEAEDIKK